MKRRSTWLLAFALTHLALVICGATGRQLLPPSPPDFALRWYGAMTGADSGYGFFAPGVGPQAQATFTLHDAAGHSWTDTIDGDNQEVRLRLGSMLTNSEVESLRPGLTASWAAVMFGRHPEATRVIVRVQLYDTPTMADFRAGATPAWQTVFEASFTRDPNNTPALAR
jgi:hypothetical protein